MILCPQRQKRTLEAIVRTCLAMPRADGLEPRPHGLARKAAVRPCRVSNDCPAASRVIAEAPPFSTRALAFPYRDGGASVPAPREIVLSCRIDAYARLAAGRTQRPSPMMTDRYRGSGTPDVDPEADRQRWRRTAEHFEPPCPVIIARAASSSNWSSTKAARAAADQPRWRGQVSAFDSVCSDFGKTSTSRTALGGSWAVGESWRSSSPISGTQFVQMPAPTH